MTITGAQNAPAGKDSSEHVEGRTPLDELRARQKRVLAELDQIEQETFRDYVEIARQNGGSQCAVTQGFIELSRRIWQNAHKVARDVRERV
jgi:hypothetical protein